MRVIFVKGFLQVADGCRLGGFGVESFEEVVEDLLASDLAFLFGVVALAFQGGFELDRGDEERAGFADRFEVAVHFDRPCAVAVAEHALVHLAPEFEHLGAFGAWG